MDNRLSPRLAVSRRQFWHAEGTDPGLTRHTAASASLHEKAGDPPTAARLYADAARSAPNLAEPDHLTRQAARINHALRG